MTFHAQIAHLGNGDFAPLVDSLRSLFGHFCIKILYILVKNRLIRERSDSTNGAKRLYSGGSGGGGSPPDLSPFPHSLLILYDFSCPNRTFHVCDLKFGYMTVRQKVREGVELRRLGCKLKLLLPRRSTTPRLSSFIAHLFIALSLSLPLYELYIYIYIFFFFFFFFLLFIYLFISLPISLSLSRSLSLSLSPCLILSLSLSLPLSLSLSLLCKQ